MLIDSRYLGNVKLYWESYLRELVSTSRNNNQLKEHALRLHKAVSDLKDETMRLPPQGRVVGISLTAKVESTSLFGRVLDEKAKEAAEDLKRRGGA